MPVTSQRATNKKAFKSQLNINNWNRIQNIYKKILKNKNFLLKIKCLLQI